MEKSWESRTRIAIDTLELKVSLMFKWCKLAGLAWLAHFYAYTRSGRDGKLHFSRKCMRVCGRSQLLYP